MPPAQERDEQDFLPFPPYIARTKHQAMQEVSDICSRFCSPFTFEEKMRLFISKKMGRADMLENATRIIAPGTPLNWQAMLRYLHAEGVIRYPRFMFRMRRNDLPKNYSVWLSTRWDPSKSDGIEVSQDGYANGAVIETMFSKAIGEVLERSFLALYKSDSFVRKSYDTLIEGGEHALDIAKLGGYAQEQTKNDPRLRLDGSSPLYWTHAETLDGKEIYVPAQLVFWNYNFSRDTEESILGPTTTNGAAGHFSKNEAVLAGLLELIQRDGFLIYWLNSISPRLIDVSQIDDPEVRVLLLSAERYGIKLYFLDTTTDVGIPSTVCVIIDDRTKDVRLALGGGTGFNAHDTIVHSAQEALAVLHYTERHPPYSLPKDYEPFITKGVGLHERQMYWQGTGAFDHFKFFISGEKISYKSFIGTDLLPTNTDAALARVVGALTKLGDGYEPYVYEMQHKVLKKLGYHVVKTIVPQLVQLHLHEHTATLGARRLREVPAKIGRKAAKVFNPYPHPFP